MTNKEHKAFSRLFGISNLYGDKVVYSYNSRLNKYDYMGTGIIKLTGYTIDELNISGFKEIITEVLMSKTELHEMINEKGNTENIEEYFTRYIIRTKSGELKWIEDSSLTLIEKDNRGYSKIGILKDITLLNDAIIQLDEEKNIQRVILQILEAANSESNLNDLFSFIHKSIAELMLVENFYIALYDKTSNLITFPYFIDRYDKEAPPKRFGKGLTEYILKTGRAELIDKERDDQLVAEGKTQVIGTQSAIWLGIPLKIRDNTIGIMVVQDYEEKSTYGEKQKSILEVISFPISSAIERKRVEQEREEMIKKLQDLNQSKDRLFSLISHDLRSPFNSLLGFSEILLNEYDSLSDEEIKEYLNVIYDSSKNLFGMTNNLLQFSRFQTGRIDYKPEKLNLEKMISETLKLLKGNVVKKQLNIILKLGKKLTVFADEDMINSILQNLITNAFKFTSKGGDIEILSRLTEVQGKKFVEFKVIDTGIGISEEDLLKIEQNHMFSTPGTDREYGTGLGLLLVK
jgi:PAS domain S-box-containing protein